MDLKKIYNGRKVFVTGHTGFKGAWLCLWLKELGAEVTGYSLPPEDVRGNLFNLVGLGRDIKSITGDIRNLKDLRAAIENSHAEIIFHLAAQPLVLESYKDPARTFETNLMGTVNLLEAARSACSVKTIVVVTTDKCYENNGLKKPYIETDRLGGHDPYSSSKAMAELAVSSYRVSFLAEKGIGVATARAGNVVGGGDFAKYRVIPDIVESIAKNQPVILRNPGAVRPWQHVLDALYGYLVLGAKLNADAAKYSASFNFSPADGEEYNVEQITKEFIKIIGKGEYRIEKQASAKHEADYLQLDSSLASKQLAWHPQLTTANAVALAANWYGSFLDNKSNAKPEVIRQIRDYMGRLDNG